MESQTAFKIFLYHLTPEIYKKKKKSSFVIALSLNPCCFSYMKKTKQDLSWKKITLNIQLTNLLGPPLLFKAKYWKPSNFGKDLFLFLSIHNKSTFSVVPLVPWDV